MATKKPSGARDEREEKQTGGKQQNASAEYDKLAREAEEEKPRTAKPGSSGGDSSKQHNNGRGGGK